MIKFIILAINLARARNILLTNATEGHAERARFIAKIINFITVIPVCAGLRVSQAMDEA